MHMQTVGLQGSPLTEQPLLLVGTLPLLLADEHKRLLIHPCVPVRSWPDLEWHHLFELQARQRPEQFTMISAGQHLTCQLVNRLGNRLASVLRCRNVGPNVLVAICMICSLPRIVGMLGILKAGRACLPLDPTTPPVRLISQLQGSGVRLLLSEQESCLHLPAWAGRTLCLEGRTGARTLSCFY